MKVKTLEKSENKLVLQIDETSPEFANSIRRAIISLVPTLAIEKIEFTENSSTLYDEIVALRVGLIPLKTDLKTYNTRESCTCKNKGCSKCTVKLTLKKQGPGVAYAEDLKSSDPEIVPAHPKILIVTLDEGQSIAFKANAILGTGQNHTKWSPGTTFYRYYPSVKITKTGEKLKEAVKVCPKNVFAVKNSKLVVANERNCDLSLSCVEKFGEKNFIVKGDPNKLIFTIESWGQLDPKVMWTKAIDIIEKEMKSFQKQLK